MIPATCPAEITKEEAEQDVHLIKKNQQGLMHCYCLSEMLGGNTDFLDIEFYDVEKESNEKWCD